MTTKMAWDQKLVAWHRGWVNSEPLDVIRHDSALTDEDEESPKWKTLRRIMREFITLEEAASLCLPTPLLLVW